MPKFGDSDVCTVFDGSDDETGKSTELTNGTSG